MSAHDAGTALETVRRPTLGIGTITPSGNVVVERVTTAILAAFPDVSGHYSRVEVTGSSDKYPADYDWDAMLSAAELLADAKPACICWNGSRGGSFGFDVDRRLCARIEERTGIRSTTATLAVAAALHGIGARRIGLVTPYRPAYIAKLPPVFAAGGFEIVTEAHAGLEDNLSYALLPDAEIVGMVRTVAAHDIDAVLTFCTNLPAAHLADRMERETGKPVVDSTSAAVWAALRLARQKTAPGRAWGSLFGRDLDL